MIAPAIPENEVERLASLRALGLLDTAPEERFDAITRLATAMFDVPIAYVSLVDENRQFLKSRVGLDFCETSRETSFCGHAILESSALVVPDTRLDARFAGNPMVTGTPGTRFYVGLPLRSAAGFNVGTLCLMDRTPRDLPAAVLAQLNQLGLIAERELQLGDVIRLQGDLIRTKDLFLASQRVVAEQLDEALAYVLSLLPKNLTGRVRTEYEFIPSSQLGGDSFGFHWLDGDRLAIYLLDVCGHGVGAALLSVSAMNVLRGGALRDVDLGDPGRVLAGMNRAFPEEAHNGLYFTMWYGVLDVAGGTLRYAAAAHPAAVLVRSGGGRVDLGSPGLPIGCFEEAAYRTEEARVESGDRLYVFSDGIYEVPDAEGRMGTREDFGAILDAAPSAVDVVERMRAQQGAAEFEDDVSVLRVAVG
jgi:sigma-B regulation protein RsbU (phosphoserine phosphatase)